MRILTRAGYVHMAKDDPYNTSLRIYMDPDGTWILHEFFGCDWQTSIIGINERDPWNE